MMKKELVLGIAGPSNAGKGSTIDILKADYGFEPISVSTYLKEQAPLILGEGWSLQRAGLRRVRAILGDAAIANETIKRVHALQSPRVVVDAIRQMKLYQAFKEEFGDRFRVLGVVAHRLMRFDNSLRRMREQGRIESGEIDWEGFCETDLIELGIGDDELGLHYDTLEVLKRADATIINESDKLHLRRMFQSHWDEKLRP